MDDLFVEATGETVGEAKWAALRELERLRPGLDKGAVRFEVVSEGERGLLGVGFAPARVVATVGDVEGAEPEVHDESELAADVRGLVEQIVEALGIRCRIVVTQDADGLIVSCSGGDLGVLIGRYGQTIDAVQYIVNAIVNRGGGEHIDVTIDAAGYRERRRVVLEQLAVRSAQRALDGGRPVELDPMTAVERKVVHLRLKEFSGVETSSEGTEPNRYVVISPV
ncbi:MAG: RNA-binding cell elongation regulator Jag/EloR [Gaiellaceae bacterium]